jgi:NAD(P)-dependent dehydrogenase (short-subunit alcohol dehydrogenase family)
VKVDLAGKTALVTGAARGIGRAIAESLAANGAEVLFTDVEENVAKASESAPGSRWARLDITNEVEVESVVGGLGRLDILVNNAGVNTLANRVTIDEFPREEWDRILDVDLNGVYSMSKAGARKMIESGGGRIINIASVAGLVPLRLQCAFTAAKAGVINLTKAMALELGPRGILVNAIAPGSILTDGTRQLFYGPEGQFRESVSQMLAHVPLGRPGTVEEIAHAALFLAAPESSYINGHCLTVDGGWTAGYMRDF